MSVMTHQSVSVTGVEVMISHDCQLLNSRIESYTVSRNLDKSLNWLTIKLRGWGGNVHKP